METGTEWIKRAYKHSVCAQTCMCMCKLGDRNYITFTVAEGRWVGRERAYWPQRNINIENFRPFPGTPTQTYYIV